MKENRSKYQLALPILCVLLLLFTSCEVTNEQPSLNFTKLQEDFSQPTDDNTLWCYWYWIGDDISKEGITKDLEAMKKAGIGAALIGNINPDEEDGKVPMLSEDWWGHMVHAVNEGKRLGVDIGAFNCPGWSQSGGPWVKPEMAMRYMTFSEAKVKGGKEVKVKLAKPTSEFQDTYVLAFPSIASEVKTLSNSNAKINVTPAIKNVDKLIDRDTTTVAGFLKSVENYQVDITANEAFVARSLRLIPSTDEFKAKCEVYANTDGTYTKIKSFDIDRSKLTPNVGPDRYAPILVALPETQAKEFRIKFKAEGNVFQSNTYPNAKIEAWNLSEIVFSEAVGLEAYSEKSLGKMHPTPFPSWDSYLWEQQEAIDKSSLKIAKDQVINVTDKMEADGTLSWNAPEGEWTIQRFGMTPTGTKNAPSAPQGKGYEIDKMSEELVRFHFEQFIGKFIDKIPEENKSAFKYVIADSYEMGSQNWTDNFEETFESTYGYDPLPFLPVYTGKIVHSLEDSERFLWDVRRLVADKVAYEYVGGLRKVSQENNLKLWLENYGHWGFPSEFLMYGGQSSLVSGEFWNEGTLGNIECKAASSAAHIYGKPMVSAEAFTAAHRSYVRHPALLKKRGDWSYTEGINHFVLHLYIHQPDDARVPGVNAWFSTEFNRHNTWFEKSKAYFDYLRRCQHLLQQGNYAADICYFIGENTPLMTGPTNPKIPKGYSHDFINAEVILNDMKVENGDLVLSNGMRYKMMVLPSLNTMRPELLEKIESLIRKGGKVYGSHPEKSPSLQNYPESDNTVENLAQKMWQDASSKIQTYGDGTILQNMALDSALTHLKIPKDVDLNADVPVLWTHRSLPGMDIYFLTNQGDEKLEFAPSFRVKGLKPQLWDAMTGTIRHLSEYTQTKNHTKVPLVLQPGQSWFVVFTSKENNAVADAYQTNFPKNKVVQELNTNWELNFSDKTIGPEETIQLDNLMDWTQSENPKVKYYSGTATYSTTFEINKEEKTEYLLDLGQLGVMASIKLNGTEIGTSWMPPHVLKLGDVLQEGENQLEVEVVNVWRNRLTGDAQLPDQEKSTWVTDDWITEDEALIPSGLMGPVTIKRLVE